MLRKNFKLFFYAFFLLIIVVNTSFGQVFQKKSKAENNSKKPVGYVVRPMTSADLINIIETVAVQEGINARLFATLIKAESGGKTCVSSGKGARGITQLMPATARRYGLVVNSRIDERCDLLKALTVGAKYLRFQLDTFGDVRLALAGYNAGEGAVLKFGRRIPPYKETTQYVEKICAWAYGRTGMALEKAYNYNHAVKMVSLLYRQGIGSFPAEYESSSPRVALSSLVRPTNGIIQTESVAESVVSDATTTENAATVEKTLTRKTIRVEQIEPKLSTRSLYFWRENKR